MGTNNESICDLVINNNIDCDLLLFASLKVYRHRPLSRFVSLFEPLFLYGVNPHLIPSDRGLSMSYSTLNDLRTDILLLLSLRADHIEIQVNLAASAIKYLKMYNF